MFTVPHSTGVPFVVTSGGVSTRVLGTSFVVRHYATDGAVHVAVTAGKVTTGAPRHVVTLAAGRVAQIIDSTTTTSLISASPSDDPTTAWTSGKLVFKEAPVSEVLTEVGRWYGYTFRLSDSALMRRHVTTVLTTNESVRTLRLLKDLLAVDMQYDGDVITLRPRKRAKSVAPTERIKAAPYSLTEVGK
jgi:transmembrane sensor